MINYIVLVVSKSGSVECISHLIVQTEAVTLIIHAHLYIYVHLSIL